MSRKELAEGERRSAHNNVVKQQAAIRGVLCYREDLTLENVRARPTGRGSHVHCVKSRRPKRERALVEKFSG